MFDEPLAQSLEDQMKEIDEETKGYMDSLAGIDMMRMSTPKHKNGDMQ